MPQEISRGGGGRGTFFYLDSHSFSSQIHAGSPALGRWHPPRSLQALETSSSPATLPPGNLLTTGHASKEPPPHAGRLLRESSSLPLLGCSQGAPALVPRCSIHREHAAWSGQSPLPRTCYRCQASSAFPTTAGLSAPHMPSPPWEPPLGPGQASGC